MLMTSKRRPAVRTIRGWAIHVLQAAGAIRECEEHGWMQDRADPHARERAFNIADEEPIPMPGVFPDYKAPIVRNGAEGLERTRRTSRRYSHRGKDSYESLTRPTCCFL
jgi:hypothetical protein